MIITVDGRTLAERPKELLLLILARLNREATPYTLLLNLRSGDQLRGACYEAKAGDKSIRLVLWDDDGPIGEETNIPIDDIADVTIET